MKILITVKTYPTLSEKYEELVCTAGFRENGEWIRIYPIPFRKLSFEQRYKKYQWIKMDLVKNNKDFRPESYRPVNLDIELLEYVSTKNNWEERKKICLKNIYTSLSQLIKDARDPQKNTSLAVFKPAEILDFIIEEEKEKEWNWKKLNSILEKRKQLELFSNQPEEKNYFQIVKKLPYKFYYKFSDKEGKESKLMISDWELAQLYWNCLKKHQDEQKAIEDVKKKYLSEFKEKKDLYFFLGTTLRYHNVSRNPFIIIGLFYPPKEEKQRAIQLSLI